MGHLLDMSWDEEATGAVSLLQAVVMRVGFVTDSGEEGL